VTLKGLSKKWRTTPCFRKVLVQKVNDFSNCKLYRMNTRISILLPVPSETMLSYKLSITTQDFFILFIDLKKGTLTTTAVDSIRCVGIRLRRTGYASGRLIFLPTRTKLNIFSCCQGDQQQHGFCISKNIIEFPIEK